MMMLRTITLIVVYILYTSLLKAEDNPLPESQENFDWDDDTEISNFILQGTRGIIIKPNRKG